MNTEKFEKDMAVFAFRQHQDTLIYLRHLEVSGWTIEDAKEWVADEQKRLADQSKGVPSPVFPCPICSKPMGLLPVNVDKATKTNDNSKSVWLCSNKDCMHTIYSDRTVQDVMKELIKAGG